MREYLDEGYGEYNGFYMEEHYVWDGDNLLSIYYMDHTDMDSYRKNMIIRGVDLIGDIVIESYSSDTQNAFYVQNGHGDVVAITDENGNVLNTYEYDSYGNVISANETYHNSLRYCGEIQGIYGDLVYLRNRIYNPSIKRFMTEDPIKDGTNWYVYCNSNPVNYWDPIGLKAVMLRYIIEKNGGMVTYNESSGTATIYMRGYENLEVSGDIINGRMVVDSEFLEEKYEGINTTHYSGDKFNSADDAAIAFGLRYSEESINAKKEYATAIYLNEGKYSFSYRSVGDNHEVSIPQKSRHKTVALVHTHANYDKGYDDEEYSLNDLNIAKYKQVDSYLITPLGHLKKYNPKLGESVIITDKMPRDPKAPKND